jgi:hypothetical protein
MVERGEKTMSENQGENIIRELRIIRICFVIITCLSIIAFAASILNIHF